MPRSRPSSDMHLAWLHSHAAYQGDDCLIWPFWRGHGGYGILYEGKVKRTGAHRLMCKIAHGEPENAKLEAAHSCHNGHLGCVNPNHLSWKTHSQNVLEVPPERRMMNLVGRRGEKHGRARLSELDVIAIREAIADQKSTAKALAREYGVHPSTISLAARGKNWSFV